MEEYTLSDLNLDLEGAQFRYNKKVYIVFKIDSENIHITDGNKFNLEDFTTVAFAMDDSIRQCIQKYLNTK
jgi:hypothetical protein